MNFCWSLARLFITFMLSYIIICFIISNLFIVKIVINIIFNWEKKEAT